jgi:murein DD-endopeptidase MepM/ murein hydrolase activator NlpD
MLNLLNNKKVQLGIAIMGSIVGLYAIRKFYTTYTETTWIKNIVAPIKGRITSGFGIRTNPVTGTKGLHNAVDISAPMDSPIVAPLNGIVSAKYFNNSGGNQIIIDSGYAKFGFAHLNRYAEGIKVGSIVSKGQLIGYVGNTGISTGTHLHFTLRLNDVATDPSKYFKFA